MLLEPGTHEFLAQRAGWYFDVKPDDRNDSVIITGDGLNDIDQLIGFFDRYPNGTFTVDVGRTSPLAGAYSSFRPCDREDAVALRAAYVTFWGTTALDRPPWVGVL